MTGTDPTSQGLSSHDVPDPPEAPSGPRAFTISALGWITFFGGPLAGAFGLAYNARRFGDERQARYAVAGGIAGMVLLLVLVFQLPESVADSILFRGATAVLGLLIVTAIAEKTQRERLQVHRATGGQEASGWLGVGMVLASWVVVLVIGGVIALSMPMFDGTPYERAGGGTVYASGDATEADARYVGIALHEFGYFPEGDVARVVRTPDSVRVSMMLIPEVETDTTFLIETHRLAERVEQMLNTPVAIINVVEEFSGRRETVLTDILSPEDLRLSPPPPAEPIPAPSPPVTT